MGNTVTLIGKISSELIYDHTIYGVNYYRAILNVCRDSGTEDKIPVLLSERLKDDYEGKYVAVRGQFRSYKLKGKLLLYVLVNSIEIAEPEYYNDVYVEGYLIKPPTYRLTPNGREISDVILAVNRDYGKCDYIPCVTWGRDAQNVRHLKTGNNVRLAGRIQSREYNKNGEIKTAYELSVNLVEVAI